MTGRARIKAVVFDFDGTLMDTESLAYKAFCDIFAEHGHELRLENWAQGIGTNNGAYDPYAELQQLTGRMLDRTALEARFEADLLARADKAGLLPGAREALEEARSLGLRIGLATSSKRAWVERHLQAKGIRSYFEAVLTSDDVERVKPDPALYRRTLEALRALPEESVAFEDSLNGMNAAKAAGMRVIAVPNEVTAHMDFAGAGADLIIESLDGQTLASLLARLEGSG